MTTGPLLRTVLPATFSMNNQLGAQFEILVDGKPRSYRDTKSGAMEAATFLKSRQPHSEVTVKDLQSGSLTAAVVRAS
jgi:hypothetical protein